MSFGERLSTRLFAAYLRSQGVPARQFDAFDIGAAAAGSQEAGLSSFSHVPSGSHIEPVHIRTAHLSCMRILARYTGAVLAFCWPHNTWVRAFLG